MYDFLCKQIKPKLVNMYIIIIHARMSYVDYILVTDLKKTIPVSVFRSGGRSEKLKVQTVIKGLNIPPWSNAVVVFALGDDFFI